MTSINTPAPMNETMRVTGPLPDKSTSSNLATTTPSNAAPTGHGARWSRRADYHVSASARLVHSKVSPVCTANELVQALK